MMEAVTETGKMDTEEVSGDGVAGVAVLFEDELHLPDGYLNKYIALTDVEPRGEVRVGAFTYRKSSVL